MNWLANTPDGIEWFGARDQAEAHVVDWFTEQLHDSGEGIEDTGFVAMLVSESVEIVTARAEDDTEDGEWLRSSGYDYKIGGYRMADTDEVHYPGTIRSRALGLVIAERASHALRGYTQDHDDGHTDGALAKRAAELAVDGTDATVDDPVYEPDPWRLVHRHGHRGAKPDRVRCLVIATSLLLAELERELRRRGDG